MIPVCQFLIRCLATLTVLPLLATYWLVSLLGSRDEALEAHSQLLALLPGKTGSYLRVAFYCRVLDACDPTARIAFGVLLSKTGAQIGRHVYIGPRCQLGLVTLEEDVLLGPAVQIPSGKSTHEIARLDVPIRDQAGRLERITIGRDCWVGAGAVVLADLESQTVVGAASVVTKTLPGQTVVGGNPAYVIRERQPASASPTDAPPATTPGTIPTDYVAAR